MGLPFNWSGIWQPYFFWQQPRGLEILVEGGDPRHGGRGRPLPAPLPGRREQDRPAIYVAECGNVGLYLQQVLTDPQCPKRTKVQAAKTLVANAATISSGKTQPPAPGRESSASVFTVAVEPVGGVATLSHIGSS